MKIIRYSKEGFKPQKQTYHVNEFESCKDLDFNTIPKHLQYEVKKIIEKKVKFYLEHKEAGEMSNVLYCLVGPSGCGKTTIAEMLEAEGYHSVQSYTTREPRYEGEEGHIFVSKDEFDKLDLITKTTFSGAFYGVTRNLIEENDLFVVDPAGLRYLKEHYDGPKKIVAIAFSCPASVCKERILKRGDTKKEACTRLRHDKKAFKNFLKDCDYEIDATQSQFEILKQMKYIIETLNWWYAPDSNNKEIENV